MDLWSLIVQGAAAVGGASVIAAAVASYVTKRWADRGQLRWKHQYDEKLESLRAQMAARQHLLTASTSTASAISAAAQERRLRAVEELWKGILDTRVWRCSPAQRGSAPAHAREW